MGDMGTALLGLSQRSSWGGLIGEGLNVSGAAHEADPPLYLSGGRGRGRPTPAAVDIMSSNTAVHDSTPAHG